MKAIKFFFIRIYFRLFNSEILIHLKTSEKIPLGDLVRFPNGEMYGHLGNGWMCLIVGE